MAVPFPLSGNKGNFVQQDTPSFRQWGTRIAGDGTVCFRLWAPALDRLTVRIDPEDKAQDIPMQPTDEGWFEAKASNIAPGTPYVFLLPDGTAVADPASRSQPQGVFGPSVLVDPASYPWRHANWTGRPWHETVLYELHIGTFTPEGTFAAAQARLGALQQLGITAIEIMPVAEFAGERGWGYEGVLLFAPHHAYGTPDELRAFVDAAHGLGMSVLLDVVYNHFGPFGNSLPHYAPDFFDADRHTPWGSAIDFSARPVRDFFIDNALQWLDEYRLDGLRLDAVDQIADDGSKPHMLLELASRLRHDLPGRHIHLLTEDLRNPVWTMERDAPDTPLYYDATWNDDFHHVTHVIATGETMGNFEDFADDVFRRLSRALAEGYVYQGEPKAQNGGAPLGEKSAHLPPQAFVNFLQNHDQVGNRALGERLTTLADRPVIEALMAILILSPQIPMLFMGEDYGSTRPFQFFCDHPADVAADYRESRLEEGRNFGAIPPEVQGPGDLPEPNAVGTFLASKLDPAEADTPHGRHQRSFLADLLAKRHQHVMPGLVKAGGHSGRAMTGDEGTLAIDWRLGDRLLQLRANLTDAQKALPGLSGEIVHQQPDGAVGLLAQSGQLPAFSVVVGSASLPDTP
ncbi:malto-oligosyltrehalose trehalohydrolase [Rhizobium sp. CG5]|nr:malto-oligosyltrehalose trehalohydrolase [Rhizobium sp. CG5]MCM2476281.1 malto-oligosyltrehalose trehalohydrolase [Rhizobium sp. CG5]